MCGIAGFVLRRSEQDEARLRELASRMADTLVHRGPDSDGFYEQPGVIGLAMRRLSIIDVAGGTQPISNKIMSSNMTVKRASSLVFMIDSTDINVAHNIRIICILT